MSFKRITVASTLLIILSVGCSQKKIEKESISQKLDYASDQMSLLNSISLDENRIPRTITEEGEIHWTNQEFDWTEGFYPGICWYLFEHTNQDSFKNAAEHFQKQFEDHRFYTNNHDLGFIFNCSFGNDYRLTQNEQAKQVMLDAGNSLIQRFDSVVGCIQSWDVDEGWQAKRNWQYPVIIDNMMNLELLFKLSQFTGDSLYANIAKTHADTTLKNHFREDGSSYHVIDYDSISGQVRSKQTAQGFANESAWARGQGWGLYGYTVCYRYTKDKRYLKKAEDIARYYLNHKNLPKDLIPYWDFNTGTEDPLRDVSAAAVIASALIELNGYSSNDYLKPANTILENLSSPKYRAEKGENNNFLLKHSVGSIPHDSEIDVPLVYADYYYIEALIRLSNLKSDEL